MMDKTTLDFKKHEELFKEKTGKEFIFFYEKFYPKLVYYTSRMCQDYDKALDISTDSFMIAFEKIDKYDKEKAQFSTWLFTIAKNLTLQDIKNTKKTVSIDVEIDEEGSTLKDFITEVESNEEYYDLIEKKANSMKSKIDLLKEPYKSVIEMREIQKMSYKDIADKVGINLSTLKSRIRNARQILIKDTKKEFEVLEEFYQ